MRTSLATPYTSPVVNAALTAPSSLSVAAIVAKAPAGRETAHVLPPKPVLERAASEENEREPVKRWLPCATKASQLLASSNVANTRDEMRISLRAGCAACWRFHREVACGLLKLYDSL